jgi:hypothetical protein
MPLEGNAKSFCIVSACTEGADDPLLGLPKGSFAGLGFRTVS